MNVFKFGSGSGETPHQSRQLLPVDWELGCTEVVCVRNITQCQPKKLSIDTRQHMNATL